jgi:uncharacterized protein (DUF362 family)
MQGEEKISISCLPLIETGFAYFCKRRQAHPSPAAGSLGAGLLRLISDMNRRDFIKQMAALGLASSSLAWLLTGCRPGGVPDQPGTDQPGPGQTGTGQTDAGQTGAGGADGPGRTDTSQNAQEGESEYPGADHLVISGGTDPDTVMEKGLQALGGIGRFVKKGHLVVIKPNFSVTARAEQACTTNPVLVAALVKKCLGAGAREVRVIDHTFTNGAMCLENSGIRKHGEAAGARVYVTNTLNDRYYTEVKMNGQVLRLAHYSKDVLDADLFINFPILKHHATTKLTMGLKNMMGLVWDRGFFHSTDLHRCIAELTAFKKPHLIIMDALRGITNNGPGGPGTIRAYDQVVFGFDPVAVDAYGAQLFGLEPQNIHHLRIAGEMQLGQMQWDRLEVLKV